CALFSPDGKMLAVAGDSKTIKLWELESRRLRGSLPACQTRVEALDFTHNGRVLASAGRDGTVKFWDIAQMKLMGEGRTPGGPCFTVAFNHAGTEAATGTPSGLISVWDLTEGCTLKGEWPRHPGDVQGLFYARDDRGLATACGDGTVRIWNHGAHD